MPLSVPGPILRPVGCGLHPFLGLQEPRGYQRASPPRQGLPVLSEKPEDAGLTL